ncbi:hypothetical protein B0H14DRAFT_3506777 [Mycena olivaceomarginata]|nr:hypothetical protein B0H14DRAFT_3506777 [Mycena olivaceomarginata]
MLSDASCTPPSLAYGPFVSSTLDMLLKVLRDAIEISANAPDPAYDDAALVLRRHQTPYYTAALTPRFSADWTPEIFPSAVVVCAVLPVAESIQDSRMLCLRGMGELSPNAFAMLRISTIPSWAQSDR